MSSHHRGVDPERLGGQAREVYDTWARVYGRMGMSESAANRAAIDSVVDAGLLDDAGAFTASAHPARQQGLSESAARILEAGAPPRSPLLDSGRPPVATVGRTDADWARVREAARRAGGQPSGRDEHLSDDELRFNDLVAAREGRGMSFREAIAEAEAAVHRVTREKDSR